MRDAGDPVYLHFAAGDHALVVGAVESGRALPVGDLLRGADGELGARLVGSRPLVAVANDTIERICVRPDTGQ